MPQRGTWAKTDLPKVSRSQVDWPYVARRLRAEPGVWLNLRDISTGMYSRISGADKPVPLRELGEGLELHLRDTTVVPGTKTRRGTLWLRWVEPGTKSLIERIDEED